MKLWRYEIMERYPPFDGWSVEIDEMFYIKNAKYRAKYSCEGVGSIYLFLSQDLQAKECMGTLDHYFLIMGEEIEWNLDSIIKRHNSGSKDGSRY